MSEMRDFLEGVNLTEQQQEIYNLVCELGEPQTYRNASVERLKMLLICEFTGLVMRFKC
jgi:hypothetical protein